MDVDHITIDRPVHPQLGAGIVAAVEMVERGYAHEFKTDPDRFFARIGLVTLAVRIAFDRVAAPSNISSIDPEIFK